MNQLLVEIVRRNMVQRSTEELLDIWQAGNMDEYTPEAFEAIQTVLTERLGPDLPPFGRPATPSASPRAGHPSTPAAPLPAADASSPDRCHDCGSQKFTRAARWLNMQNGKLINGSMRFIGGIILLVLGAFLMLSGIFISSQLGNTQIFLLYAAFGIALLLGGSSLVTRHLNSIPVTLRVCTACKSHWLTIAPGAPPLAVAHSCPECHSLQVAAGQRRVNPKTNKALTLGGQLVIMSYVGLFGAGLLYQGLSSFSKNVGSWAYIFVIGYGLLSAYFWRLFFTALLDLIRSRKGHAYICLDCNHTWVNQIGSEVLPA